jgi:hypothetical protein
MHPTRGDLEVDAVEGDDLAKALADPARANRKRRPAGAPAGRRVAMLFSRTRQFESELGMVPPGTCDGV